MAGQQQFVGKYRMYHLIRAGALYEIWAVRPPTDNTLYAIKWLPKGENYTREHINGLRHEYAVGSTLNHPECIKTYEFGTSSDGAFLLLELFKVPNLKQQIIAGSRSLWHRAQPILVSAASGLAHLHERGWIHRDIKPDNYLLGDDNHVKLIDFNLARKPDGALSKLFGKKSKVQGTHSYMSPEQIRGQPLDVRTDIYSFGCVTYELFAGKTPFTANTPNELLQRHLSSKPPDLTVIDKNITPEFARYVQRMMAKDAKARPDSMKDVMMDFKAEKIFYNPPQPPVPEEETQTAKRNEE